MLTPTELSLSVTSSPVFVGDEIIVTGRLSAEGEGLGDRQLSLIIDDLTYNAITEPDGSYQTTLTVPFRYSDKLGMQARYSPKGDDHNLYQAASSPALNLEVIYYVTQLDVRLPVELHPGLALELQGTISSDGPPRPRNIRVFLNGQPLGSTTATDTFTLSVTPPITASSITANLIVQIAPDLRYAGASAGTTVPFTQLASSTRLDSAGFIFIPGKLVISGTVNGGGLALSGAVIDLSYTGQSTSSTTDSTGRFSAQLNLPMGLTLFGTQPLSAKVTPAEAWYAPLELEKQIVIINPISTGLILALLLGFAFVGRVRLVRRQPVQRGNRGAYHDALPSPSIPVPVASPQGGIKGGIIHVYLLARRLAQSLSGIFIRPGDTIREYLRLIAKRLPALAGIFSELTLLAEIMLYSRLEPGQPTLLRAEQLLKSMQEDPKLGTP